jgi:Calx-beta domain/Putative Ig domain
MQNANHSVGQLSILIDAASRSPLAQLFVSAIRGNGDTQHHSNFALRDRSRFLRAAFSFFLIFELLLWSAFASAQVSLTCPSFTRSVPFGGSVVIDVSACDGIDDFGIGPHFPATSGIQHGTVTINTLFPQTLTYTHNGTTGAGTLDDFTVIDNNVTPGFITFNINIGAATSPITINPSPLPAIALATAFSQTLSSTGGTAPYTYNISAGTLPTGLSLSSGGVISGTPTQRGNYTFTVRSRDSAGVPLEGFRSYNGTIQIPTLSVSPAAMTAIQGAPFSQTLSAAVGVAPFTFALDGTSPALPAGLTLSGGVISGTTSAALGVTNLRINVTDSSTGSGPNTQQSIVPFTVSAPPTVTIAVSPASVSEDGATNLTYTVTRSLNLSSPTTVNITTGGTATSGTDYTGGVATVVIPAGATTATIIINPSVDGTVEADETVILTVAAGTGYTVGAPASATGTILNDDVPSASISVAPAAVAEDGVPNLIYTVTLNQASLSALSINYTVGGTATNGTDYATITSPLVIPAGNTTGTITVNPTADATIESNETAIITLAAGTGYTVGVPASATGTITNDDLPTLTINDVTANEGNAGITNFTFTVSLSAPAGPGGVTFDIATANGTATAGVDYVAQSLTGQTIPAGSSTYTFTVQVNGDTLNEPNETFFVNVTNVTGATVGDGQGLGTITNDDALPSLSTSNITVTEGNSGTVNAVVTVTLSAASGQTVTVNYATADGSATAPTDYTAASGTLTFTPGQTSRTITVLVNGDTTPESNETFSVGLFGATNATISIPTSFITITNDDVPVTLSPPTLPNGTVASAYSQTITASGGTAPYAFTLSAGALPGGFTLTSGGVLSGSPSASGTFNFTVTATDSSGAPGPYAGSTAYSIVIGQGAQTTLVASSTASTLVFGGTTSLSTTGGSGTGTVTFASNNANCTIIGTILTAAGVGTCTVTATKAADANYTAATSAGITITINQATQTTLVASSTPSTLAFGGTAMLSITGGSGAGVVTYASNSPNCTIVGATLTAAGVGTCTVTATKAADTNYVAATSAGITITVNQAAQATLVAVSTPSTVTFGGTTNLSTTGGSGAGGVTFASNSANCTIVGTTLTAAGVGTCTVTATKAADTNYTAATSAGITVTINPAPQATLIASSAASTLVFGGSTTLSTTGGSGTGLVTFASNNANCTISGNMLTAAAVGTCTITATKTADTNYTAATSAGITITVNQATQATLVAASAPSTVTFGGTTTLSTTGGSGTGVVTYASSNANCTISGTTLTAAAVGTCTITATKAADTNYTAATSAGITVTINQAAQPTLIASSAASTLVFGGTTTLSTTGGGGTGLVTFASNNANCTISSNMLTAAAVGTCTITATKAADANYTAATSSGITITINPAPQATLIASSAASTLVFGGSTTLSTTGGSGTGLVTFASNNANCTISSNMLTAAAVGTCTITATKAADASYAAATSAGITITVNPAPQTTLVASSASSTLVFGGTTALSTTGGLGTGAVTFASNNANCTIVGNTLTAAGVGSCTVTATKAADASYTAITSAGITITINQAPQATLIASSAASTLVFGGTATLSTTGGSGSGAVTFASNNANCTVAGATLTAAAVGTCTVTATKAADASYAAATSAGITITINQAPQATLIAASAASTLAFGGTTTLSTTGGSGTGLVTFASNNANCTIAGTTLTAAAVGSCTVTATKAADTNYLAATSAGITITVTQATQTITFSASIAPSLPANAVPFTAIANASSSLTVTFTTLTPAICASSGVNGARIALTGSIGVCTIRATQAGSVNYLPATADRNIAVTALPPLQAQTTATLTASVSNNVVFGTPFTLNARLVGFAPTGSVDFTRLAVTGNETICANVPIAGDSSATCSVPIVARSVGNVVYAMSYAGDVNNTAANATLAMSITPGTVTLSGAVSPVKPIVGQPITLTALIVGADPTGNINFNLGSGVRLLPDCVLVPLNVLPGQTGDPTTSVATCKVPSPLLAAGRYTVTMSYSATANNQRAEQTLTFDVEANGPKVDYSDMWWAGQEENGWGLAIVQKGSVQFNAFYVYDSAGKPTWYVMPGGQWNTVRLPTAEPYTIYSGLLYQPTSSPFREYDATQFRVGVPVGNASITFMDANTAVLTYNINGIRGEKQVKRQPFGVADSQPRLSVSDMWWSGSVDEKQNGWGITLAQQERQLFGAWFTYGEDGKPTWFVLPGGTWSGTRFSGDLYATTGSAWLGVVYDPQRLLANKVGTVTIDFANANEATMTYTVNGLTQTKRMTRQPF